MAEHVPIVLPSGTSSQSVLDLTGSYALEKLYCVLPQRYGTSRFLGLRGSNDQTAAIDSLECCGDGQEVMPKLR